MPTDAEYVAIASQAWEEAVKIANSSEGWKEEKSDKTTGDLVEVKKNAEGRKIYRCKALVALPPSLLVEALSNTDTVLEWNTTLAESRELKKINDEVAITYQVTTAAAGGMVSARDFVYCAKKGNIGDVFVMGGRSVEYNEAPIVSSITRAINGPGCHMVSPVPGDSDACNLLWLMDCNFKGWMPQSILDVAMPVAQTQFIDCVRKLAKTRKNEGRF